MKVWLPTRLEDIQFGNKNVLAFSQWCDNSVGFYAGLTTGTPIHVFVPNTDQRGGVCIYFSNTYFVMNETYGS
jgi:hypothetical protein